MACEHATTTSDLRYLAPRKVVRVYKCQRCRRIVRRVRSRWASRRWTSYKPETAQTRQLAYQRERERRRAKAMPYAERLHEALEQLRSEVRWRFKGEAEVHPYHPLAIRYRRLLRKWWQLSSAEVTPYMDHETAQVSPGAGSLRPAASFQKAARRLMDLRWPRVAPEPDEAYALARRAVRTFLKHEPTFWEPVR